MSRPNDLEDHASFNESAVSPKPDSESENLRKFINKITVQDQESPGRPISAAGGGMPKVTKGEKFIHTLG